MAKFFIGLATGVALVFFTVILLIFAAFRMREKPPVISDGSVLVMHLSGSIPEKPPIELPDFLDTGKVSVTVSNLWLTLQKAAADKRVTGVVIEPEGLAAGWAKLEEIRSDLENFRHSGKPVYAYLRMPGAREYYVAAAADRVYLSPQDPLMLKGMRAEIMYFKKTLDKLGVSVDVQHAGKYKDFGDMFTRSDMSPETREVLNSLLDELYGNLVTKIAAARKKSPEEMRNIIDQGPFTAKQALKAGLVDELRFEDEMWGELKTRLKADSVVKLSLDKYLKVPAEDVGINGKSRIALVAGAGDILRGSPGDDGSEESSLTAYGFNKLLKQVGADSSIKGVIVRIDSPGGEVSASDEILREMLLLSKKKPVVISMSDVAASGGYYMALTGDPIVAYPQTETGSIGVVFGKPNLRGLYEKLGISKEAVQRGKHADIDSDYTELTPDERKILKDGVDDTYVDFVSKVAAARKRKFEEVEPVSQGRVWTGSQAKAQGLVDELGGLDRALEVIKQKANIPASEQVRLQLYPAQRNLLDVLLKRSQENLLESRIAQVLGRVPFRAWVKGGYLRMMPYWVEVQ